MKIYPANASWNGNAISCVITPAIVAYHDVNRPNEGYSVWCGVKRWYGFRDQSISKIILTGMTSSLKTLPADTPQALAEATSGGSPSDKVAESSVDDEAIKSEQAQTLQKHALKDTPNGIQKVTIAVPEIQAPSASQNQLKVHPSTPDSGPHQSECKKLIDDPSDSTTETQ
ncbi:hypothetical protein D8B26_008195 [Coccidioides posadasii str. Silveira]|uniref:uncharacterized protein n=1 Tax=Coccidioides posadasii (strain RMSCC 757 / Silveira) TaxID=443226 RepID=UPI001BED8195|nr:hypothetical protein D8B26_008195 [Coccidioides posadasii str. Silveira]